MSTRHLDSLFEPRSVAVFGASDRPGSVGATVWANLAGGGFDGPVWPVNPRRPTLGTHKVYARASQLPEAPELAVICTPPATVAPLVAELGARGTRAAIVMSATLDARQRRALQDAARPHLLRVLGPNCLGLLNPRLKLNASFAHVAAAPGSLAFVSQSGALVTAMLDWAAARGVGFSLFASIGDRLDVDFGDMIDYLASDPHTRAILLYVEAVESARKFMSAARAAARNKPVLIVKAGRTPAGQRAAASHTGALASSDLVFDAAIRRAGMLRVGTLQELFTAAEMLSHHRGPARAVGAGPHERLTVLTNGGGAGVLAADAVQAAELALAEPSAAVLAALTRVLPAGWSHANPVDIVGDAPVARYVAAIEALHTDASPGTLLFIHAPTAIVPSADVARAVVPLLQRSPLQPMTCWLGGDAVREARAASRAAGLPTYDTPEEAVRAFSMLQTYRRNQELLLQTPPAAPAEPLWHATQVHAPIEAALAEGREWLTEPEAKAVLAAVGVPVVATRAVAAEPEAAVAAAQALGFPVALKIIAAELQHKSDAGAVVLDLDDAASVRDAAGAMLRRVHERLPGLAVSGFSVQTMVRRPRALELIVGATLDPLFGPVILFGSGGTEVEVVADRAVALPPLNRPLARALVERTRVAQLLAGWRDVPPADVDAVCDVLVRVSQLLADEPRIVELDLNPLLADAHGVVALDARIRVDRQAPGGSARFAIRPYPADLSETVAWQDRWLTLRPIRPEDEVQHLEFLARLDPADIRMRVFYSRRSIEHSELARLTQIDYEREMAFLATAPKSDGSGEETLGVVRALCDPDNVEAEFGIVVRSDLKGARLGERLMRKLIDYLRARGTRRLVATVLTENRRMLDLAGRLGFDYEVEQTEPGTRRIVLAL
ncbi:bifunctional acetate--CoA ligase family protein/GNAT family N-acetyltransferase [Rubrivivax gelatinosus]|uniref:GNAT family N-acetyltransferase n=1 Tax=Rubrivivax gelatinosus TaxID=28068 RepID=A0ABS1DV10_RUBGE|nr:bifunctional acetate--CoA ligase family protein/GNAT family N-acetyltransferase [Rubrivivax gelatinosus]MBK1713348.1 GNAT family N-acetyltransferase [Rubrivivax gelatinosus]